MTRWCWRFPVALLVRIGLADGFSEYELPALGCVALLLLSFPWVGAPVGLGATLIVATLIVRRAGGPRPTMMSNMSTLQHSSTDYERSVSRLQPMLRDARVARSSA